MRLSAHDASFLYNETTNGPMHGVGITVLDGPATHQEILEFYAARIHQVPRLRQKLAFVPYNVTHPKWIDDPDFTLENHVKAHPVPPGTTLDDAVGIALELGEQVLDRSRPLWMTYVLENVQGQTLLAQMSHHAFVDGATAVAMSTLLTDAAPDAAPPPTPEQPWQPAPEPNPLQLWGEALREQARAALESGRRAFTPQDPELIRKANALMARMARPVMQAPWNAGVVGPKRRMAAAEYPLEAFKPIRKALGGTINDIVVAVVAEGAARYMKSHREFVDNQYLRLMCPVNVRDGDVDPTNLDGNRVSAMFPVLPAWPMSIEQRYQSTREELERIKKEDEPRTLDALQQLAPPASPVALGDLRAVGTPFDVAGAAQWPLPVQAHVGPRPLQTGFNFTCTNVAGPSWKQYVAGHGVVRATGTMMLGGNLGFGVGVGSSSGNMIFGFTADPRLMPDVEKMRNFVAEAFEELAEFARQRLEPSEPATASRAA